ncbi:MAG: hypothetical protein SF053_03535 [Bacteroidia bacterium]|nr:hypothetical protein [Bacteroidia bacterium]
MKSSIVLMGIWLIVYPVAYAQSTYFSRRIDYGNFGEYGTGIVETPSGYVISGSVVDLSLLFGIGWISLDKNGAVVVKKRMGSPNFGYDSGLYGSMITAQDGRSYICGTRADFLGNAELIFYCFSPQGDTLWTRVYGDSLRQNGYQCRRTPDGGFVLLGRTETTDPANDFWLIKTDSLGIAQWDRTYR